MRRKGTQRSIEKERAWRAVVERQRQSGLSIRAFCRRDSLSEPSFYAWRRELWRRDRERSAHQPRETKARPRETAVSSAFLPVTVTAAGSVERVLEVSCGDGLRLSVWPGCDASLLQAALSVLTAHAVGRLEGERASC